jgi:hypothetical protein
VTAPNAAWHSDNNCHSDSDVAGGHHIETGSIAIAILRNAANEIYSEMIEGHSARQIGNSPSCKFIHNNEATIAEPHLGGDVMCFIWISYF